MSGSGYLSRIYPAYRHSHIIGIIGRTLRSWSYSEEYDERLLVQLRACPTPTVILSLTQNPKPYNRRWGLPFAVSVLLRACPAPSHISSLTRNLSKRWGLPRAMSGTAAEHPHALVLATPPLQTPLTEG